MGGKWHAALSSALVLFAILTNCVNAQGRNICDKLRIACIGTLLEQGDVRLVDGYRPAEGRVEIYYNGCWGTICDDFWSLNDATVVCRQLGYPRALQALRVASHGQGTGSIVLDDLLCSGAEENLLDCPSFTPAGTHNCAHSEDASVVCENDISK